jgi:hypothetical protein
MSGGASCMSHRDHISEPSTRDVAAGMKLLAWLKSLWKRLRRRNYINQVLQVESRGELPRSLGSALYVIGEHPKWVILKCPCGCGEVIDVNLMKSRHPAGH